MKKPYTSYLISPPQFNICHVLIVLGCLFWCTQSFGAVVNDLMAYWSFDDAKNPLLDVSGNGNNLAFSSSDPYTPWSQTTADGKGSSYRPTNSGIFLSSTFAEPVAMPSYSVSFWLNPTDLSGHYNCMGANGDWGALWMHTYDGGNSFYIGQTVSYRRNVGAVFSAGNWTNLTYTYDNGVATIYKDGDYLASYTDGDPSSRPEWYAYRLGTNGADNVSGHLDNVSIWKNALSPEAVKMLATNRVTATQLSTLSADAMQLLVDNPTMNVPTAVAIAGNEIPLSPTQDTHADAYARKVLGDNPVAYWRMDDATKSTEFRDLTGNGHTLGNLENVAPGTQTSNFGIPCAEFLGGDNGDIINAKTTLSGVTMKGAYSLEYWVNPDAGSLVTPFEFLTTDTGDWNEFVMHSWGDKFYVGVSDDNGKRITPGDISDTLTESDWNYVAYTFDGTNQSLYLDGELVASKTGEIGNAWNGWTLKNIDGLLSDMALYDYALTPGQIAAHFNTTNPSVPEPATWALLLLGVGILGYRRVKSSGKSSGKIV